MQTLFNGLPFLVEPLLAPDKLDLVNLFLLKQVNQALPLPFQSFQPRLQPLGLARRDRSGVGLVFPSIGQEVRIPQQVTDGLPNQGLNDRCGYRATVRSNVWARSLP